jgi:SAM-dependent methyltransferase
VSGALSPRARLYDRLPVTADVDWWCDLARQAPDGRVLELGAGTGRLTLPLAEVADVVAVDHDATALARLRARAETAGVTVRAVEADVTDLDLGEMFGAVLFPVSLLNELPAADQRRGALAAASRHCCPDGVVAFQLLNPVWLLSGGRSSGVIEGVDGEQVELEARHRTLDLRHQRARAELRYRFADGEVLVDVLEAAAVFPTELDLLLASVGLEAVAWWGSVPVESPLALDDGAWHVVARPARTG